VLSKFFESLYNKVFVNIVVERSQTTIYAEECNKKGIVSSGSESFDTTQLSNKMYEYISLIISESPFYYIAILDTSDTQGAFPTSSSKDMSAFCDIEASKYICHKNDWTYYTAKSDLNSLQKTYSKIGIDFIFSPFLILSNFFKDKIDNTLSLYILLEDNYISICVFDNGKLLYGEHIDMEHRDEEESLLMDDANDEDIDIELDLDGNIDLEDIDAMNDIDGLDDFGDIEDLDSIDEIDEFAEAEDEAELVYKNEQPSPASEVGSFNEDYQRFSLIQSSVNRFYKDKKYDSKFVESVYIADGVGVSGDLKRYLEEEIFLSVFVRHLDLGAEVCELAKAEL
jgi:hypothetical protein